MTPRRPEPVKYVCPVCGNTITMRVAHDTPKCSKNGAHKYINMQRAEATG